MSRLRVAEPAVSLTDLAIAVETARFARALAHRHRRVEPKALRRWFAIFYLPAVASLAGSFSGRLHRRGDRVAAALGMAGLGLTMIAAWVQIRRIALHPRHFDHNASYHVVQAAAFAVLNNSAGRFCSDESVASPSAGAIVGPGGTRPR